MRGVLDPEHLFESDHYLVADRSTIALSRTNLAVDVERFLADAEAGVALVREGKDQEGVEILRSAESAYTGDFLEEDAYEDWAVPLREEARAVFASVRLARSSASEAEVAASSSSDSASSCRSGRPRAVETHSSANARAASWSSRARATQPAATRVRT